MLQAVADTHAVTWYLDDDPRLSQVARSTFETVADAGDQIGVSSLTLAEMVYLAEKGRSAASDWPITSAGHAGTHHCRNRPPASSALDQPRSANPPRRDTRDPLNRLRMVALVPEHATDHLSG